MKIGIITIIDNNNFGNRLQNYALSYYCSTTFDIETYTLLNNVLTNNKNNIYKGIIKKIYYDIKLKLIDIIKYIFKKEQYHSASQKRKNFFKFNDNIKFYSKKITALSRLDIFDYLIVGSDQVWNPNFGRLSDVDVLKGIEDYKKISYAASFGIDNIEGENTLKVKDEISKFNLISVREDKGKEIVEELTGRKDIQVLIDPTMLLSSEEWNKICIKPNQIDKLNNKKYIFNYFLGDISNDRRLEIERIAKEYNCEIINILDSNSPFFSSGPSEFLYLEKNAFLICTDSFHACVFAIIFDRPFVAFNREQENLQSMNSRIYTLISKFQLKNRQYNGNFITKENIEHNYSEAYKILENERIKSKAFLEKALKKEL